MTVVRSRLLAGVLATRNADQLAESVRSFPDDIRPALRDGDTPGKASQRILNGIIPTGSMRESEATGPPDAIVDTIGERRTVAQVGLASTLCAFAGARYHGRGRSEPQARYDVPSTEEVRGFP